MSKTCYVRFCNIVAVGGAITVFSEFSSRIRRCVFGKETWMEVVRKITQKIKVIQSTCTVEVRVVVMDPSVILVTRRVFRGISHILELVHSVVSLTQYFVTAAHLKIDIGYVKTEDESTTIHSRPLPQAATSSCHGKD